MAGISLEEFKGVSFQGQVRKQPRKGCVGTGFPARRGHICPIIGVPRRKCNEKGHFERRSPNQKPSPSLIENDDHEKWSTQTMKVKKSGKSRDWEQRGTEKKRHK